MRVFFCFILLLFLTATDSVARENENLLGRDIKLPDSLPEVNRITEQGFDRLLNEKAWACTPRSPMHDFVDAVFTEFGGHLLGVFEQRVGDLPGRIEIDYENSSIREAEGPTILTPLILKGAGFSPSLQIGEVWRVGADKFGHAFGQGYEYFRRVFRSGAKGSEFKKTLRALAWGDHLERGFFGLATTGVYSYADLAANFGGFRFFQDLLYSNDPYFRCEDGRLVRTDRRVNWADYVDDSWDEGINCSRYGTKALRDAVAKAPQCPAEPERCRKIGHLPWAHYTVSPVCLKMARNPKASVSDGPERPWQITRSHRSDNDFGDSPELWPDINALIFE